MTYRDAFAGTAWYYARYRLPYPDSFFDLLISTFHLDGTGRLLDLGCGTGQIAIPLSRHFQEVVAMDPEPEMLAEAKRVAALAGASNMLLLEGGSSDLDSLRESLGVFRLIIMGSSFHWMDREATLYALSRIAAPGCGLVVAASGSFWTGPAPWCKVVRETVQRWLGEERRAGSSTFKELEERHETIIDRSPFGPCRRHVLNYWNTWTIEQIIGTLYSSSFCSPPLLGDRKDAFEKDLRRSLLNLDPTGRFTADVSVDVLMGFLNRTGPG